MAARRPAPCERGWAVRALVRDENKPAARLLHDAGASLVTGDMDDPGAVRAAMNPWAEQLRAFDEEVARMFEWMDRRADEPDLAALRADHPGLLTLQAWLRATSRRPEPTAGDGTRQETKETR